MHSRIVRALELSIPALSARGLCKSFARGLARAPKRTAAIHQIDIDLYPGEVIGLIGNAGSGKTTLLQCLAGLLRPDQGKLEFLGERFEGGSCPPSIAYVPAVPVFYPFLTPRDIVELRLARESLLPASACEANRLLAALGLDSVADTRVMGLPRDVIRRVSIAEGLAGDPAIILIDTSPAELVSQVHPSVLEALGKRAESGSAVMMATRDASSVAFAASRMFLIERGRAARTFALESFGEPILGRVPARGARFVAERVH
jgi:ABC-type multidrug transport system ATPase subunit